MSVSCYRPIYRFFNLARESTLLGQHKSTAALTPSPLQRLTVLRKRTCGTMPADGCHAHDDLGALLDGLPSPAGGSEVSSGEAGLDRIELDLWQRLGVLDSEHRDGGLTRAVNDGGEVEL